MIMSELQEWAELLDALTPEDEPMTEEIKPFQPSNGTCGDIFMRDYCWQCAKFPESPDAKKQCRIFLKTMFHSISDPEYPREWRYVDGEPTCTAFKDRDEHNAERRAKTRKTPGPATDKLTLDIFGGASE